MTTIVTDRKGNLIEIRQDDKGETVDYDDLAKFLAQRFLEREAPKLMKEAAK